MISSQISNFGTGAKYNAMRWTRKNIYNGHHRHFAAQIQHLSWDKFSWAPFTYEMVLPCINISKDKTVIYLYKEFLLVPLCFILKGSQFVRIGVMMSRNRFRRNWPFVKGTMTQWNSDLMETLVCWLTFVKYNVRVRVRVRKLYLKLVQEKSTLWEL